MVKDYAHLNYPDNKPIKDDIVKLINLFELNSVPYWVDFATLEKIKNNRKSLYYLNTFDVCITEEYKPVLEKILEHFYTLEEYDHVRKIAPGGIELLTWDGKAAQEVVFNQKHPTWDRILKWIYVWIYKYTDSRKEFISLGLPIRDFTYNKEILTTTEDVNVCGINLKVPVYYDLIKQIRFKDHPGEVWCHGPKKREDKEREWGFCNYRRDEL